MLILFHKSDLDGHASGAILKYKYPEAKTFGMNYGDPLPEITIGETVFMVDFSMPMDEMVDLNKRCNLVLLDHHKSFIDSCKEHNVKFSGIQRSGLGACALVWEYCEFDRMVPYAVMLLSEHDVWIHDNPDTLPFQYGLRMEYTQPGAPIWEKLLSGNSDIIVDQVIKTGKVVLEYQIQSNTMYAESAAFETELAGFRVIAQNKMFSNSQAFDSVFDPEKHDIMALFGWRHGQWSVSLYSAETGPDVSKIAVQYGGGGHAHAAGFGCDTLPFELK